MKQDELPETPVREERRLEEEYGRMAADTEHEREAEEWSEGLIGDVSNVQDTQEWFRKLDELNTESFPSRGEQPLPTEHPDIE